MVYIAQHMIRHNGVLFYKGDEIEKITPAAAAELIKHGALVKIGKVGDGLPDVPSDKPSPPAATGDSRTGDSRTGGSRTAPTAKTSPPDVGDGIPDVPSNGDGIPDVPSDKTSKPTPKPAKS